MNEDQLATLPEQFRLRPQWVVVKPGSKEPYQVNGRMAKVDTPTTWEKFPTVCEAVRKDPRLGVGYVFSATDPYCGVDLDHCYVGDKLQEWASEIVNVAQDLGLYIELSRSGTGLHIIGRGSVAKGRRVTIQGKQRVEMYSSERYFIMTGDQSGFPDPGNVDNDITPLLLMLEQWIPGETARPEFAPTGDIPSSDVAMRLASEFRDRNAGNNAGKLWDFQLQGLNYPSASEAREGLLYRVAAFLNDPERGLASVNMLKSVVAYSPMINDAITRNKWPRLANTECAKALAMLLTHKFKSAEPAMIMTMDGIMSAETAPWIIKDLIQRGTFNMVAGAKKSGKSFLVTDMALAIARMEVERWADLLIKHHCRVLYCNAEGSMSLRLRAYVQHHKCGVVPGFNVVTQRIKLNEAGALSLKNAIEENEKTNGIYGLIVIDTLNRFIVGDESSGEDMGAFINHCERLTEPGRAVLAVHHLGKDLTRGARGHSSLEAAVATQIDVVNNSGQRGVSVSLQRDAIEWEGSTFRLEQVKLGKDADGDDITSAVVAFSEEEAVRVRTRREPVGRNQLMVLQVLRELSSESQDFSATGTSTIPQGAKIVRLEALYGRCAPRLSCEAKHKRERVDTALSGLQGAGWAWISDPLCGLI